jgi:3-hydroxyacyl-[acyl-carrier-protein] dehydratase
MKLNTSEILKILKHRYPLVLLDNVEFIKPMKECLAKKNFSYNEWFFQAHFPQNPIVPGSLQIEAYTQAVYITLLTKENKQVNNFTEILLISIDRVRFYKSIRPGDTLIIEVKVDKVSMGIVTASVKGYISSEMVSECKIGYKIKDFKNG